MKFEDHQEKKIEILFR